MPKRKNVHWSFTPENARKGSKALELRERAQGAVFPVENWEWHRFIRLTEIFTRSALQMS